MLNNCDSAYRNNRISKLRKFLPIDVMGSGWCANKPLLPQCVKGYVGKVGCMAAIAAKYYFYLAIEDDECDDYIGDKVWNSFQNQMIPIVWGTRQHYDVHLPPKSYLNGADYPDLYQMILKINLLAHDRAAFLEYHEWKARWTIYKGDVLRSLCEYALLNQSVEKDAIDLANLANASHVCNTESTGR
jgi:hypothetical protein